MWFVNAFETYYHTLVGKALGLATSTTSSSDPVKKSCWKHALGLLRTFSEELKKVRAKATSAHICATCVESNAIFLHCTL